MTYNANWALKDWGSYIQWSLKRCLNKYFPSKIYATDFRKIFPFCIQTKIMIQYFLNFLRILLMSFQIFDWILFFPFRNSARCGKNLSDMKTSIRIVQYNTSEKIGRKSVAYGCFHWKYGLTCRSRSH